MFEREPRSLFFAATAGLGITAILGLTGCGDSVTENPDRGGTSVGEVNDEPRQVWENVTGHPQVAAFCIGENGVYTVATDVRNRAAPVIIPADPNCDEGGVLR
jgi:hypothetical protein